MAKASDPLIKTILSRGVAEVIDHDHLDQALRSGKRLRVKFGVDPTAPDLHLGHTVPLRKLRQFQDAGHKAVLIIGDFTAAIGDPSGRSETRKPLTEKEVKQNMRAYLAQAAKAIDVKKAEVRWNSEWHRKEGSAAMLELAAASTIQQVLERADFKKRLDEQQDISVLEMLYPLFQGYDSVKVRADVEIGGTDQKFNLLMGRRVQRHFGLPEQDVMTLPLLEGTDGIRKMSKSFGNVIPLRAAPNDMFGKVMAVPDALIGKYFELLTDSAPERTLQPRDAKLLLARTIVGIYHGAGAGKAAEEEFVRVFSRKELPRQLPEIRLPAADMTVVEAVLASGTTKSRSEARRLVMQGAVRVNNEVKKDPDARMRFSGGEVLKIGKRHFVKVKV
ncbi:MAG: tyrosine--tRNA ligase [Candidatus Liptonbacteria bacterium]|nr:tyrosine--tRNA ligase [Candidatus Liptonbacteria bacterium]